MKKTAVIFAIVFLISQATSIQEKRKETIISQDKTSTAEIKHPDSPFTEYNFDCQENTEKKRPISPHDKKTLFLFKTSLFIQEKIQP